MRVPSLLMAAVLVLVGCSQIGSIFRGPAGKYDRGYPSEHDSGPDSEWAKLFGETPNYRAYGQAVIGGRGEKFRWKFGPMWYRGRLDGTSQVLVIGQEGAQDENVTNRAFTGSTGTKMQQFLNHMGINKTYTFMNTFIYTITGQYSLFGEDRENPAKVKSQKRLLWLAQDDGSIVVEHRHRLFDHFFKENQKLAVVVGVGTAGKDSAATLARHWGGKCYNSNLSRSFCKVVKGGRTIHFFGVPHPGAASARNGGSDAASRLQTTFNNKAQLITKMLEEGKIKMKVDKYARRQLSSKKYYYGNFPVPHRDFPFGYNWRMGASGTSSNRRGSHTIQVFSSNGCYNNSKRVDGRCIESVDNIKYDDPATIGGRPSEMASYDVPYESPKYRTSSDQKRVDDFDKGPGKDIARKFQDWFSDVDWEDLGVTQHMSFGPNGFYRGQLEAAETLVIADQFSHDDFFSGRALTGRAGQALQAQLNKLGTYTIIRTVPVDTLDLSSSARSEVANNSDVEKGRNKVLSLLKGSNSYKKIIAVGKIAKGIAEKIAAAKVVSDQTLNVEYIENPSGSLSIIPRADLPAHTRWWMGTSGDRAARGYRGSSNNKVYSGDYYKVYAPRWATKTKAGSLTPDERTSVNNFKKSGL
ncbi:MAG: hypothetical protein HN509_18955 [Halobacteriovoraceae bacterium]|nr:hypothetical protein [Halobacteriovoraceae bacterium]MBT5096053.1 hypothetical protein [Halobacteriovoraceae bacterium]